MPYKSLKQANPAIRGIDPAVTLAQANLIASWADSIKDRRGDVNPWAVAISLFKRKHHTEKGKWVKDKASKASSGDADEFLNLIEGLEEVGLQLVRNFPPFAPPSYPYSGDDSPPMTAGEPAYKDTLLHQKIQKHAESHHVGYFEALYAVIYTDGQADVNLEDLDDDGRLNAAAEKYAAEHNVDYLTALKAVAKRTRLDAMGLDSNRAAA